MQFNPIKNILNCNYNFSLVKDSSSEKIKLILFYFNTKISENGNKRSRLALFEQIQKENAAIDDLESGKPNCFIYKEVAQ
jgi:hypothetical protein